MEICIRVEILRSGQGEIPSVCCVNPGANANTTGPILLQARILEKLF